MKSSLNRTLDGLEARLDEVVDFFILNDQGSDTASVKVSLLECIQRLRSPMPSTFAKHNRNCIIVSDGWTRITLTIKHFLSTVELSCDWWDKNVITYNVTMFKDDLWMDTELNAEELEIMKDAANEKVIPF
jgi:hypothetical protein